MSKAATDTLEKVSSEFEAEVLDLLEAGKKEAAGRLDAAKKEVAEQVGKILDTSAKQAEAVKRQIIGAAELESRNAQLKALERAIDEAFEQATKEVSGASDEEALLRLIKEGIDVIGPKAKVACSSKEKRQVSAAVRKLNGKEVKLTLADEPVETIGGVVLTSSDGTVRFDNTYEARLERMRPTLRKEVAGILTAA